jgi:hypothetical protein
MRTQRITISLPTLRVSTPVKRGGRDSIFRADWSRMQKEVVVVDNGVGRSDEPINGREMQRPVLGACLVRGYKVKYGIEINFRR